jgi:hypothetical protein
VVRLILTGRLDPCFLVSLAAPAKRLRRLVPHGLEPVEHAGYGFWNVVVCRVVRFRPAGVPAFLGGSFWQVAHRIHVRAPGPTGEGVEGLFFLHSDVERALFAVVGNLLTDFRFRRAGIEVEDRPDRFRLALHRGELDPRQDVLAVRRSPAARDSSPWPFPDALAREGCLRYAPLSLAPDGSGRWWKTARVSRDESAWSESPVEVEEMHFGLLRDGLGAEGRLVRATEVAPIDYRWELGGRLPAGRSRR